MNATERELSIRRILVALDASPHSVAALENAAELAEHFEANLIGLFVEDVNLIRAAELPFAQEIGFFSPIFRPLQRADLERHFRMQAAKMRETMQRVAQKYRIAWEFKVARGPVSAELLAAEEEADLTVLGRIGRARATVRRIGSTVRSVVTRGRRLTMIMHHGIRLITPVMAIYDGSPVAEKALRAGRELSRTRDGGPLLLYIIAEDSDTAHQLQEEISNRTADLQTRHRVLVGPSIERLAGFIRAEGNGPVVVPCGEGLFYGERLCALVDMVPNPVLLVR